MSFRPTVLPESVRTALLLSSARSKQNVPTVPDICPSPEADRPSEVNPGRPRDCVRVFPSCSADHVLLVTYDWRGNVKYKSEIPADEEIERWSSFLLRRCRERHPAPNHLRLLG